MPKFMEIIGMVGFEYSTGINIYGGYSIVEKYLMTNDDDETLFEHSAG